MKLQNVKTSNKQNHIDIIKGLVGVEEFKIEIKNMDTLCKNIKAYNLSDIILPNYLWITQRGGGLTTLIHAFAEFLD